MEKKGEGVKRKWEKKDEKGKGEVCGGWGEDEGKEKVWLIWGKREKIWEGV